MKNIEQHLKMHDIKPSYQRVRIYGYLLGTTSHPTVDEIYQILSKELSTLSKTTVYNTLNLFIEKKIAQGIVIEENEMRYDAKMEIHGHFKCKYCNEVSDISNETFQAISNSITDFTVDECHFYFKGICKQCKNELENYKN